MNTNLIDGKKLALDTEELLKKEVSELKNRGVIPGLGPGLATILVGENPASQVYVKNKELACARVGIHTEQYRLSSSTSEKELLDLIIQINHNPKIHGILVQLPLPSQISEQKVIETIAPEKDVDGFHPMNLGNLLIGKSGFIPCTPYGVIKMLESISYSFEGKSAVIVGRSNIVGKPMALLLLQKNATVTIAHSKTKNLPELIQQADLVIAALGKAEAIKGDWIKEGAVVIDVGINRVSESKKIVGDVEFEKAKGKAAFISPVPGGVGPMTITMLLSNTIMSAKRTLS